MALVGALVAEARDGVGDGDGLADARGFDDDVVELARGGDVAELAGQVVGERAAQAAVGHGDEVALDLREAPLLDEARVHVDLADVVDDDGGADALLVGEDVVEQGGLAGAEVAGEQDYLGGLVGVRHGCARSLRRLCGGPAAARLGTRHYRLRSTGVRQLERRATVSTHTAQTAPASARPQASPRACVRAAARLAYEHTAQAV